MTAALEGGKWPAARLGRTLPPGKTRYPLYRRLGKIKYTFEKKQRRKQDKKVDK